MRMSHAVFYSKDIQNTKKFYKEKFDLIPSRDQGLYIEYELGEFVLAIKQADKVREVPGHQTIFITSTDIASDYKKVQALNVEIYKEHIVQDWGSSFSVLDIDGNKLEYIGSKD